VIFEHLGHPGQAITFETRSGALTVSRKGDLLEMIPGSPANPCASFESLASALGRQPLEVLRADDYLWSSTASRPFAASSRIFPCWARWTCAA